MILGRGVSEGKGRVGGGGWDSIEGAVGFGGRPPDFNSKTQLSISPPPLRDWKRCLWRYDHFLVRTHRNLIDVNEIA